MPTTETHPDMPLARRIAAFALRSHDLVNEGLTYEVTVNGIEVNNGDAFLVAVEGDDVTYFSGRTETRANFAI